MTKKIKGEPTEGQVAERLKAFGRKHRKQYPVPPVDENEPCGLLAGNPDHLKQRMDEEFDDNYGEKKPELKLIKGKKPGDCDH